MPDHGIFVPADVPRFVVALHNGVRERIGEGLCDSIVDCLVHCLPLGEPQREHVLLPQLKPHHVTRAVVERRRANRVLSADAVVERRVEWQRDHVRLGHVFALLHPFPDVHCVVEKDAIGYVLDVGYTQPLTVKL